MEGYVFVLSLSLDNIFPEFSENLLNWSFYGKFKVTEI